jgi:hypothetical protein
LALATATDVSVNTSNSSIALIINDFFAMTPSVHSGLYLHVDFRCCYDPAHLSLNFMIPRKKQKSRAYQRSFFLRQPGCLTAKIRRFPSHPCRRFGVVGIFPSLLTLYHGTRQLSNCGLRIEVVRLPQGPGHTAIIVRIRGTLMIP